MGRGDDRHVHAVRRDHRPVSQTFPGSVATYSGTASPTGAINGLPQLSTLPYSGGAVPTSLVTGAVPRNWAPPTMSPDHVPVFGMPEHARLEPLPPVIPMSARYAAVPPTTRSDRRDRGHRRGRLPSATQEGSSCPMPDGHTMVPPQPGNPYLMTSARRPVGWTPPTYDPVMGDRKTSLTVTVDPRFVAYAEQLVEAGKAADISAVVNDALSEKVGRDALDRLRKTAAHADPAKVDRMLAHIDTQAAALPER